VAVLPFDNMSADPEQEYFADGMVEDILTGLARIRWLTVIARNSSFAYKGRAVDVREVGRALDVRYVLEGSVRRGGRRLRIAVQRHARAALATGADDPAALALGALVVAISERDYATASGAVGRALAINPSSALGWGVAALVSAFVGDYAAALDQAARAIRLNP